LTVARGHQNPFGGEGMFARKFIADHRLTARQLKPESREEFRAVSSAARPSTRPARRLSRGW
jgi:hypothetical protein